jgi:pimeloyl-ACP methyl ester carboxylesterase
MVRLFALTYPDRVLGVVLVDAVTPDVMQLPAGPAAVRSFGRLLKLTVLAARVGLMRPVAWLTHDLIGLSGEAKVEKRRIHGSARHAYWASKEVDLWPATSDQCAEAEFPPALPIAVITAGAERGAAVLKSLQALPAIASRRGYVEHVAGAKHASLLGLRFADPVVRGVAQVLAAARA